MYGLDFDYAGTRLEGTLVRNNKDEPVWVLQVRNDGNCICHLINKDGDLTEVTYHVDNLNLQPVKLGFCNYSGNARYISRVPMRRDWKQGMRANNIIIFDGADFNQIPRQSLRDMIMGKYPTFAAAFKGSVVVNKFKQKTLAFHRHWAVRNGDTLLYKFNKSVGTIVNGEIHLSPEFWHLKEYLERCM